MNRDRVVASRRLRLDIRTVVVIRRARLGLGRLLAAGPGGLATLLVAFLVAACSAGSASPSGSPGSDQIDVVTTTTVFATWSSKSAGSHVRAASLVPRGGDVHTFEPKPGDVQTIARAKLLVMNGLGLDDWLEKTITTASAAGTPLVKLGEGLTDVELLPGEDPGTQNPHLFMDVKYGERYVDEIAAALERGRSGQCGRLRRRRCELQDAPGCPRRVGPPEDRDDPRGEPEDRHVPRRLPVLRPRVRDHDRRGTAVAAPGQDPSAGYTAQLIDEIKASGVKAIFSESQFPTKLVDQLATETGRQGRRQPVRRLGRRPAGRHLRRRSSPGTPTSSSQR